MRAASSLCLVLLILSTALAQSPEGQAPDNQEANSNQALGDPASGDAISPATALNPPAIQFLTVEQGRLEIIDESYEPYISGATDNFLRFCIGATADAPIPSAPGRRREMAEAAFKEKVQSFSESEQELIRDAVSRLNEQIGDDWPLVSKSPWRFVKVDSTFCSGFPHTRGKTIILPAGIMPVFQHSESFAVNLLLHEKLHVLQRLYPERFEKLYTLYGFEKIRLADGELARVDYGQNPDAFGVEWAIKIDDQLSMLIPTFQTVADGRLRFNREHRTLVAEDDGQYRFGPIREPDDAFEQWKNGFGGIGGLDHPNETSAYLSARALESLAQTDQATPRPDTDSSSRETRVDQTRKAFGNILRELPDHP